MTRFAAGWRIRAAAVAAFALIAIGPAAAADTPKLPYFASLRSSEVNVRIGPSTDHRVAFVFVKAGLPVEVVQTFNNWRRIRDATGDEGWVFHSLLSSRRTALVMPWKEGDPIALKKRGSENAATLALLDHGVLVDVVSCDGDWCHVSGKGFGGYVRQTLLWGVYPGEKIKE